MLCHTQLKFRRLNFFKAVCLQSKIYFKDATTSGNAYMHSNNWSLSHQPATTQPCLFFLRVSQKEGTLNPYRRLRRRCRCHRHRTRFVFIIVVCVAKRTVFYCLWLLLVLWLSGKPTSCTKNATADNMHCLRKRKCAMPSRHQRIFRLPWAAKANEEAHEVLWFSQVPRGWSASFESARWMQV